MLGSRHPPPFRVRPEQYVAAAGHWYNVGDGGCCHVSLVFVS
jgi:hypothetical protein